MDGRVSTGLSRPDVFDWFDHVRDEVDRLRPHALVFLVGANDNHDLLTGAPAAAEIGPFGTRSWVREYRRRVGGLIDDMAARGVFVVWLGLPITRSDVQSERFEVLNRIYRSEARERPGEAAYIDTWALFQDESGGYTEYLPDKDGDAREDAHRRRRSLRPRRRRPYRVARRRGATGQVRPDELEAGGPCVCRSQCSPGSRCWQWPLPPPLPRRQRAHSRSATPSCSAPAPSSRSAACGSTPRSAARSRWVRRSSRAGVTGLLPKVVVIHLGSNGPITRQQFDALMKPLKRKQAIVLTVKEPRAWEEGVNSVIRAGAKRWKNATLLDWHWHATRHPEWLYDDGIHLRPAGAVAYARLISKAVKKAS